MDSTQTNGPDKLAMLDYAKQTILEEYSGYACPVPPTDEYGIIQPFDPGCVPWVAVEHIEVTDAFIDDPEHGIVTVRCNWEWTGEDPEQDVELEVPVFWEDGEFTHGEIERVN